MKLFGRKIPLIYLNLAAFILGCLAGLVIYKIGQAHGMNVVSSIVQYLSPLGNILVNMLKMIVIPIIFFSLICGASSMPAKTFGKMGIGVCAWYFVTSLYATIFGCVIALLFNPQLAGATKLAQGMAGQVASMQTQVQGTGNAFLKILYGLFANPFQSLAEGNFLPIIVFAILFGLASRIVLDTTEDENIKNSLSLMLKVMEGIQSAIFRIIEWVMAYFPIGIFALTACSFGVYGFSLFQSYLQVAGCVIAGILLMLLVCYPLMVAFICRVNPFPILWKLREPILTAFVTRSSAATLPVSMRTADEKLNIRKELSSFTLSLGATVNMDGVCIHLPVFAVLAANMFDFQMTTSQMVVLVLSVVFASVGAGGVPGGSIFLLFMVLGTFNLSPEQVSTIIALALGINPLLDMFETACNVAGDNIGTYVVAKRLNMFK